MSDTHGRTDFMQKAADRMVGEFGVDAIVHLGDDYADAVRMNRYGRKFFAVPGMFESAWDDKNLPHRLIKDFGGIVFLLSHTPTRDEHDRTGDINPERARARFGVEVLLHGHTHRYGASKSCDGLITVNPGHLKADADKGRGPTFAVLDAKRPRLVVKVIGLDGGAVEEKEFEVSRAVDEDTDDSTIEEPSEFSSV